ncbi:AI-2E family transporter [Brevibacillus sp. B_LB10_24]|uniref:AI-2E family transporter n=1 Tax=Brevibacillus sp. B_LB10_24 TaxID=3380645 RepID=UPI0038BC605D
MENLGRGRFFSVAVGLIVLLVIVNLLWWIRPLLSHLYDLAKEILVPFLVGLIIAYLLHPIVSLLERRKVPRLIAVLLIYVLFVLTVVIALLNALPVFAGQLAELADDLPRLTNWYHMWMNEWEAHKYFLPDSVQSGVDRVIIQSKERMAQGISDLVNNARQTLAKLLGYAVVPFIAFYMLKDMEAIQRALLLIIPRPYRKQTLTIVREVNDSLGKYVHGQLVVALVVGISAYIGYWLIGMPYPFVLAFIVSLANVIPYIGPLIGAAPALVVALTISTKKMILVLVVNLIIQVAEGNILSPNIVGRSLHLHPLLIIFALLAGEALGGLVGMVLAVPVMAVLKVVINRIALMSHES